MKAYFKSVLARRIWKGLWKINLLVALLVCLQAGVSVSAQTGVNPERSLLQNHLYIPLVMKAGPVCNGDFEAGHTCWTEYSTHDLQDYPLIRMNPGGTIPHSGTWAAWLGGFADEAEVSILEQPVSVPVGAPYLAYWHQISSFDDCGGDFGRVIVNAAVVDQYNLCTSANTGGWAHQVVNLSPYAGQTVVLQIMADTDASGLSSLYIDDVTFQANANPIPGQADESRLEPIEKR